MTNKLRLGIIGAGSVVRELYYELFSQRRNSAGLTIGISRNGRSGSRCFLSPLTMQSASPAEGIVPAGYPGFAIRRCRCRPQGTKVVKFLTNCGATFRPERYRPCVLQTIACMGCLEAAVSGSEGRLHAAPAAASSSAARGGGCGIGF